MHVVAWHLNVVTFFIKVTLNKNENFVIERYNESHNINAKACRCNLLYCTTTRFSFCCFI